MELVSKIHFTFSEASLRNEQMNSSHEEQTLIVAKGIGLNFARKTHNSNVKSEFKWNWQTLGRLNYLKEKDGLFASVHRRDVLASFMADGGRVLMNSYSNIESWMLAMKRDFQQIKKI